MLVDRGGADRASVCVVTRSRSLAAGGITSVSGTCRGPGMEAPTPEEMYQLEMSEFMSMCVM